MTDWKTWFQQSVTESGDSLEASHYDSARSFYIRQRAVLEWLGDVRGKTILDVGPGAGHFSQPLATHNTVIGVDFIPDMLKFAANKGLLPVQGDGMRLPLASDLADVVICVGVLQHIDDTDAFIRELLRVRKSDGQIYLVTLNQESLIRKLYYMLPMNEEIMHTYRLRDVMGQFEKYAPGVPVNGAVLYYPFPGYRRVGRHPGFDRIFATAIVIRVN